MTDDERYRMTPIPMPPFTDDTDRDASLGAVLVHVTHTVVGWWPSPAAVKQAVELLTQPRFEKEKWGQAFDLTL